MKKQLIFLRGVSGSGKTTLAKSLALAYNGYAICADDYFYDENGNYNYDEKEIVKAHQFCFSSAKSAFAYFDTVIVHNTSVINWMVQQYQDLANEESAEFISLVVENRHGNQNVHNVSDKGIKEMAFNLLQNLKLTPQHIKYDVNEVIESDNSELEVVSYLKKFSNLDEGLKSLYDEHAIGSTRLNGKVLLKYAINAKKDKKIVRECRGIILSEKDLSIVSLPFEKFGNYQESYADNDIDFSKSVVMEKLDGSCLSLYFDHINNKWCVQTLGQVEAEKNVEQWQSGSCSFTWSELFFEVFKKYTNLSILDSLDKNNTYIFELCTPYNRVVVEHTDSKLYLIGIRNKITLKEWDIKKHELFSIFDTPKEYDFDDLNAVLKVCGQLTDQEEGFVVVEKNEHRFKKIKLKSKEYIQKHYAKTSKSIKNFVNIIFLNEQEEFIAVFPEFKEHISLIEGEIAKLASKLDNAFKECLENSSNSREFYENTLKADIPAICSKHFKGLYNKNYKNGYDALTSYKNVGIKNGKMKAIINHCKQTIDFKILNQLFVKEENETSE